MNTWWDGLSGLNRAMYGSAVFFSVFFVWQMISALIGLGGEAPDLADGHDVDAVPPSHDLDAAQTDQAFQLLSIRSILTFLTLFTWGSALYLNQGDAPGTALGRSALWGLAGMACIAVLLHWLPKLAHTGTKNLVSCVGCRGSVYLDIPAGGVGEVRVMVSGVQSHVMAGTPDGAPLKAGTSVVVVRQLDQKTVEVKAV